MSNTDSFIDEVTEEVRRDRLYSMIRKYGWIAVLAILVLVGGAAWTEYQRATHATSAQAAGDEIVAALALEDPLERADALNGIEMGGEREAIVALLSVGESVRGDDIGLAVGDIDGIATSAEVQPLFGDMIAIRKVTTDPDLTPQERIDLMSPISAKGGHYALLAEEQIALAELEAGERDAAIARLRDVAEGVQASQSLRTRATQLLVALNADGDTATQ
ncbi:hypothetical protein AQS8620_01842 [Aquimixticola soesokkakensis]|uniref:Tetratricopeptide repeat-like domain-containing protein n=1 Tax=Aquimixticola soesokkakensis TaxID=1519096 RepID=A0A1Y5SU88_9RHOB|nr:hypothetical protein [Aquimixticola soesokkakensis]SLN45286.1 hypothetical protein AQS8620_01842 [Aquimixticola soesokkakensis]